jgi:hypothetical protein
VPQPTPTPDPAPTGSITIIRHGEKPSDANDHTLAPKGHLRADALPGFFTSGKVPQPTWVFASKGNTTSQRMVQTARPTVDLLHVPLDTSLDSENAVSATAKLLVAKAKAGETVLAVLEHSAIPGVAAELVKALGGTWATKPPKDWADSDFATAWVFAPGGRFSVVQEAVLPGDKGYQPPAPPSPSPAPSVPPAPVPAPPVEVPAPSPAPPPVTEPDPVPSWPTPSPVPAQPSLWEQIVAWFRRYFG